tara:strand:- start:116 stop:478 length:363 start_codon:yes stop_codon:yes gene_type:complete
MAKEFKGAIIDRKHVTARQSKNGKAKTYLTVYCLLNLTIVKTVYYGEINDSHNYASGKYVTTKDTYIKDGKDVHYHNDHYRCDTVATVDKSTISTLNAIGDVAKAAVTVNKLTMPKKIGT